MSGSNIVVNTCNTGNANQKWIFNSGEYQNYMQIQHAGDTNLCVDGGAMTNGSPLRVTHCNGHPSQTFARDVSTGAVYLPNGPGGNACMDAGTGIKPGKTLQIWECNVLPQQQLDIVPPKMDNLQVVV